jgi:arylsulfatase A-like enzyme
MSRIKEFKVRLKNRVGPAGPWLNRGVALLLAVWAAHAVLRMAVLFRKDGFGHPLVGKADWYIFHALFIDLHWIFIGALPLLLALAIAAHYGPRLCAPILTLLAVAHAGILVLTVIDHETLRFMGMHFDPGMMRTYGNSAATRDVLKFVLSDASIPGLPYALLLGCVPLAWLFDRLLTKSAWARAPEWKLKPVIWIGLAGVVGYLYVYQIWPGGNRMRLLRPVVQTAYLSVMKDGTPPLAADSLAMLTEEYRRYWFAASNDTNWVFPLSDYPFYRVPLEVHCARPEVASGADTARCGNVGPRPAAPPGKNAEKPWNIVLILMETQRAMNIGHLKPYGAPHSSSPYLDSMAARGSFWTRMVATGLPTINSWMSLHLSVPQHPTRFLASEFTTLTNESFVQILGRHGYMTRYFSTSDPAWDNKTPWLRQWYQGFDYDRTREHDAGMFAHLGSWMRDSLTGGKPFFITAMTKTNHYPFNPVEGVRPLPASATLLERMDATMRYADSGLKAFMEGVHDEPWFDRTVFVVMADHGFPLGEHGSSQIGYGLYTESMWMPLVMTGSHPKLGQTGPRHDLASGLDLAPTFLELAGIRAPNSFMGHSLLQGANPARLTFSMRGEQAMVERGDYRWHGAWGSQPRQQGEELFDLIRDRGEFQNLMPAKPEMRDSLSVFIRNLTRLHVDVLERDVLWPTADSGQFSAPPPSRL